MYWLSRIPSTQRYTPKCHCIAFATIRYKNQQQVFCIWESSSKVLWSLNRFVSRVEVERCRRTLWSRHARICFRIRYPSQPLYLFPTPRQIRRLRNLSLLHRWTLSMTTTQCRWRIRLETSIRSVRRLLLSLTCTPRPLSSIGFRSHSDCSTFLSSPIQSVPNFILLSSFYSKMYKLWKIWRKKP